MRLGRWLVGCAVLLGGCFDEGGDAVQTNSALAMGQGLMAFQDIESNISTDPGAAGAGLFDFIKTPIAAYNLVAPPFDLAGMPSSARVGVAPASVPACITTSGPGGCDSFTSNSLCEAGDFTFMGNASRTCLGCPDMPDVAGACTYNWNIDLTYTAPDFTLTMTTTGPATVSHTELTATTEFRFDLDTHGYHFGGDIDIRSCQPGTIQESPTPDHKPRKLVNAFFAVSLLTGIGPLSKIIACSDVHFDGNGDVTVTKPLTCTTTSQRCL